MANRQHYPPDLVQVTPSGIRIEFYDRHEKSDAGPGQRRHYLVNGEQPVSVTTALAVLDKPALKSWAQKIGIQGALALAADGQLSQDYEQTFDALRSRHLCWWDVREQAAGRGTLAHDELVRLAAGGHPRLATYPQDQLGFVRGVCGFYADFRPQVEQTELMVASAEHGVCGRLDLRCELLRPETLAGGSGIVDLKTIEFLHDDDGAVKPPYLENLLQLAAYEGLSVESGYPPTDFQAVLRVDSTGAYDFAVSWARYGDFLAVLDTHRVVQRLRNGQTREPVAA